eukprot:1346758-Rhodomonas_salina.1
MPNESAKDYVPCSDAGSAASKGSGVLEWGFVSGAFLDDSDNLRSVLETKARVFCGRSSLQAEHNRNWAL